MAARIFIILAALALSACGGGGSEEPTPPPKRQAVVFMGDSITEGWSVATACDCDATNAGISGQTTVQMRERFERDVLARKPDAVVILGGWNDLEYVPAASPAQVRAMAQTAKAAGIRVVLLKMTPANRKHAEVAEWNRQLASTAAELGVTLVDTFTPLADATGNPLPGMLKDGVHPAAPGYEAMNGAVRPHLR